MYELIILSLLMRSPSHVYLIVKITNDQIGPWAKISSGTLYPLLTRMEQVGLIARAVQMLAVVQETMHLAHISLWLRQSERHPGERTHILESLAQMPTKPGSD